MQADDIRETFINGKPASAIAEAALARIEASDDIYGAVIVAGGPGVISQVARLDATPATSRDQLMLGGVPILVKDNIETREWPTTAGSLALADNLTDRDAGLIKNLREAGAIILGKANLSEWANFRSEQSISGWSGVGGQVRNAHDPARSPCGSSSGSAVAVALGYVPVAIGSETDGSIVCPASVNGVVGFKPTHGIVPGDGIVPLAASQDTAGPIAISVRDAAITLGAMLNTDQPLKDPLLNFKAPATLKGVRIGVLANTKGYDQRRDDLLASNLILLEQLGAEVTGDVSLTPYDELAGDEYQILLYEFSRQLNDYLKNLPNALEVRSLDQIIAFNAASEIELSLFDQSIFEKARDLPLTEAEYQEKLARMKQATRADGIDALLANHDLDVIVGISGGPAWMIDDINGDAFHGPSMSSFPAIGGHPHITVPMGNIKGMPIGLSFVGARFSDAELAAIAAAFEQSRLAANGDPIVRPSE